MVIFTFSWGKKPGSDASHFELTTVYEVTSYCFLSHHNLLVLSLTGAYIKLV